MLPPAFNRCHDVTSKWEGGWSNHKADPGGATMYGVTQRVYDSYRDGKGLSRQSVRNITLDEALDIYFNNYWLAARCGSLVPGVDLSVYDASVNSGVSRGRKWLRQSIGSNDHTVTVKRICGKRLSFVEGLSNFKVFGRGWSRRIADVQAKGVAWASAYMDDPVHVRPRLQEEAADKKAEARKAGGASSGAGAATGTGGGDIVVNPEHLDAIGAWLGYGLLAAGVVLTLYLAWRFLINRDQAQAFEREAETY